MRIIPVWPLWYPRWGLLLPLASLLTAFSAGQTVGPPPVDASPADVTITIHVNNSAATPGKPVNRRLLGSNIQWAREGDGLLRPGTLEFKQYLADQIVAISPTVMRYPGGSLTDTYHWLPGMGPIGSRGMVENALTKASEPAYFGTKEFLSLCVLTGAEPLISLNEVTGDAQEAADWVRQTNVTGIEADGGERLPSVNFWEIGNEPYLLGDLADLRLQPEEYARRANLIFSAVKGVDSNISVGIPVVGPNMASYFTDANVFKSFNQTVLPALTAPPDFVAVHDGYLPVTIYTVPDREPLYYAMAGGATLVKNDLDNLRAQVQSYFPNRRIPFALTEYNALYTLNQPATDGYIATLASAIYLADLVMMLAQRDDMLMANFWSVLDNWMFGAISSSGNRRPGFQVLYAFSDFLHGEVRDIVVEAPTFDAPPAGMFPGENGVPVVSALAVEDQGNLRVMIINKDVANTRRTLVEFSDAIQPRLITKRELYADDYFATFLEGGDAITWKEEQVTLTGGELLVDLRPHSVVILEILPTTANNPAPSLQTFFPTSSTAGGLAFSLGVTGTGFVPESVVRWNGNSLTAAFISTHQLQASIPAGAIANGGTNSVTVINPAPGGGLSNPLTFPVADFTVEASSSSLSVNRGQSVTTTLTLASQFASFGKDVSLSCSGLPSLGLCSFSPSTVTPGTQSVTSSLKISTSAGGASLAPSFRPPRGAPLVSICLALLFVAGFLRSYGLGKRRFAHSLLSLGLLLALFSLQAACGGGGKGGGGTGNPGTPAGTYTVVVTGTSGSLSHQINLTLKVN